MIANTEEEARRIELHAVREVAHEFNDYMLTPSRLGMRTGVEQFLRARGWTIYAARYEITGECTTCGESSRCPGWHVLSREKP